MSKITIRDVAKQCNVSVSTVSRAINNHPEINQRTRNIILKKIKELGYTPNSNARNLKRLETNTIAVLIKGIGNLFFQPMFKVLENEITKNGYSFLLYKVEEQDNEIDVALKLSQDIKPKGIIFLGGCFMDEDKKILEEIGIPFVVTAIVSKNMSIKNSACVGVDDFLESKKMVNYLLSLGHKKIAIIGSRYDDASIGMLRVNGYKQALTENNISIDENLIFTTTKNEDPYTFEYGYKTIDILLDKKLDFSAIYCVSDAIAIGVLKRLREKGIKSPRDYSVVGFDGLEINDYLNPTITTIKQPVENMALTACNVLFNIISGKPYKKVVTFEGELFVGQTTDKR
ncbi:LacI family DNA-binding transcriptional regulator [Peptoanaerobacter stomatis]|jgi:hypothetical protein|uniref:Transcriptional regulator, LacI family n=1 Tax=Peptoanaerobacter stomatis TaxID=796937 RepID=G9WXB7_9FIRM|nr:LacI family DNA-binding transcriptional regulator [Peptoanaerobacter stomatis]EHL16764.1 hypothetical protein HMPREF9629_00006 [Peptoanaerobacter stomatis]EHL18875.1 hypothetical protein HMPREF9628_01972 [Peptoanaerobacter stomatis]EJU23390.1 transcriptional regulator, LacI family [Peptoanaerobacter stomatis]NWO24393.1 LacI family DNA-binding transcriptional regulator [Peptostreptococcaceae bacterium oral taxon 081]